MWLHFRLPQLAGVSSHYVDYAGLAIIRSVQIVHGSELIAEYRAQPMMQRHDLLTPFHKR